MIFHNCHKNRHTQKKMQTKSSLPKLQRRNIRKANQKNYKLIAEWNTKSPSNHGRRRLVSKIKLSFIFLSQVANPHQESETEKNQILLTIDKVLSQLNILDESSAPGSDCVKPKLLKSCAVALSYPYLLVYIKTLREGKLPLLGNTDLLFHYSKQDNETPL